MDIKQNILKWYPFKENASVLEIYDEESILENVNLNIKLDKCNIKNLSLNGEYDYITLIGTFEYVPTILDNYKCYSEFLKRLKKHLTPNGTILIAIDNRLGVKYLTGGKYKNYSYIFEGMEKKIQKGQANLLTKQELIKFIREAEFENFKFYYPLPDYRFINSIFTDDFMPKSSHSKILYPVNYDYGSTILYNEINIFKQICDIGQFDNFTNSYIVEISNSEIKNDICFVNYNNFRKDKYKLLLTIKKNEVEKIPESEEAISHVRCIEKNTNKLRELGFDVLEKIEENKIISPFEKEKELDKKLVETLEQYGKEVFKQEIRKWYNFILEKLPVELEYEDDIFKKYDIDISQEQKKNLRFVKNGYIDLAFENVFCKNDGYLLYDQEWYLQDVPIEFILYRALNNLYTYNNIKLESKISREEIMEEFELKKYETYFEQLERKIQADILNSEYVNQYQNEMKKYYNKIENIQNELERKEQEIKEIIINKDKEINEEKLKYNILKNEKEKITKEYEGLLNEYNTSRGWKIIKTIRKVARKK